MTSLRELCGVDLTWYQHSIDVNRCDLWAGQEAVLTITWSWDSPSFFVLQAEAYAAEGQWPLRMSWHWGRQVVAWQRGVAAPIASFESGLYPEPSAPPWLRIDGMLAVPGRFLRWDRVLPANTALTSLGARGVELGHFPCSFFDEAGRPLITYELMLPAQRGRPWLGRDQNIPSRVVIAPEAADVALLPVVTAIGGLLRLEQGTLPRRM